MSETMMPKPDFYQGVDITFGDADYSYLPVTSGGEVLYKKARVKYATDPESGVKWRAIDERVGKADESGIIESGTLLLLRHNHGYLLAAELDLDTGRLIVKTNRSTKFESDWLRDELNRGQEIITKLGAVAQQVGLDHQGEDG